MYAMLCLFFPFAGRQGYASLAMKASILGAGEQAHQMPCTDTNPVLDLPMWIHEGCWLNQTPHGALAAFGRWPSRLEGLSYLG